MTLRFDSKMKLFGNCKVEWQIENLSLQTYAKEWFIRSPEFTVNGSEETSWYMTLQPKLINGRILTLFSVKKSALNSSPVCAWLNVKIFKKIETRYVYCSGKVSCIKNRSKCEMSFGAINNLFSLITKSKDLLTIVCHMIIYSKHTKTGFGKCKDEGLGLLSKNMSSLYSSSRNYDTKISVGDCVFLAHKVILHARNDYLSCLVEDDDKFEGYHIITLSDIFCDKLEYNAMTKVLAYLYTGDIRHVLEEPSFAMQNCVSFLEINEIERLYEPDQLNLISTVDFEVHAYTLHGYQFENSHLLWHCYTKESMKEFRLLLYPEKNNKKEYISLFSKTSSNSMLVRLDFEFISESGDKCTVLIITDGNTFIDIDRTIEGDIRKLNCSQGTFEVKINLKLTAGRRISYIDEQSTVCASCISEDYYFERLSRDLQFFFDDGFYTDTVIDNNGTSFEVHKCILASRCSLFSDILDRNEEDVVIALDFDNYTLCVVLIYLYTGRLQDVIDDEVLLVYEASVSLDLFQLQSLCSDWLKLSSKTNRNIRCKIVRIAEKYQDSSLLNSVLDDLFNKKEIVLIPNHWTSFPDVHTCRLCLSEF